MAPAPTPAPTVEPETRHAVRPGPTAAGLWRLRRLRRRRALVGWGFAAPFTVLFVAFMALPVLASLAMSVTDMRSTDLRNPFAVEFVGARNFVRLFGDELFRRALFSVGQHRTSFGLLLAGAVVVVLPVLAVFLVLQRQFLRGIATTGLK
jgi:ABC-type sugar transport system permease subunit